MRARSPAKKTTKTAFSCLSPVMGSTTVPTVAWRRYMLPRVARNSSRSNAWSAQPQCGQEDAHVAVGEVHDTTVDRGQNTCAFVARTSWATD